MKQFTQHRRFFLVFLFVLLPGLFASWEYSYAAEAETVSFTPSKDAAENGRTLTALLGDDSPRTIVFPENGTIKIDRVLWVGDNKTILANGCTIIQTKSRAPLVLNAVDRTNYKSTRNVRIVGGTWKTVGNNANVAFRFAHSSNLALEDCTIPTNYQAHGIELIACKNVTIKGCTVLASGNASDTSLEEAIQIDVATPATAPSCADAGTKYVNGQTCENITVKNCTVRGSRGICCNFTDTSNKKYINKFHKNIKIIGNTITGTSSQALTLHNTVGFTVKNNRIITKSKRYSQSYSDGLSIAMFGSFADSAKYKNSIVNNTIKGGRCCISMNSATNSKFGETTVKSNKLYCKSGANNAMKLAKCTRLIRTKNETHQW